jgi:hypothetical protein
MPLWTGEHGFWFLSFERKKFWEKSCFEETVLPAAQKRIFSTVRKKYITGP